MPETIRLNITSDPANLAGVRQAIEGLCMRHGFDPATVADVGLCVNEAIANVTRHAYSGAKDRPIEVNASCDASRVEISIRDWGSGIDPTDLPQKKRDPLKPGGLGLVCLSQMLDGFEFKPQPDGMLLEMTRENSPRSADKPEKDCNKSD